MKKRTCTSKSWSHDLPTELVTKISKHIQTRNDLCHFRQTCRKWQHYSKLPTKTLSHILPLSIPMHANSRKLPFHHSTNPLLLQVSSIYILTNTNVSQKPCMIMVEESKPGKIQLRHPFTGKRVRNTVPELDLSSRVRVKEVSRGFNFKYGDFLHKVVLCRSSSTCFEVMVLYYEGVLGKMTLGLANDNDDVKVEYCLWGNLNRSRSKFKFMYLDDIVVFKGMFCGVDRKGRVYVVCPQQMCVTGLLVADQLYDNNKQSNRRKRLVVDEVTMELYLVERMHVQAKDEVRFKVYKLNEQCKWWDKVESLGRERVLFVGNDHCFFAKAKDFESCEGNCIVFASDCFTQYSGRDSPDDFLFSNKGVEVGVYQLGKGDNFSLLSSAYPEFAHIIWPPPLWLLTKRDIKNEIETKSKSVVSIQSTSDEVNSGTAECLSDNLVEEMLSENLDSSTSGEADDDELPEDSPSEKPASELSESSHSFVVEDDHEQVQTDSLANSSPKAKPATLETDPPTNLGSSVEFGSMEGNIGTSEAKNHEFHDHGKDESHPTFPDISDEGITDVKPTVMILSVPPAHENCYSKVKFQGVDISAKLIPTLESIWAKHGSLIGKDTVRSKKILASALEELAELVITLKYTTIRSLTDSQADDLQSDLLDFQRQGLKVDWLVPTIDKAVKLQKGKSVIESIMALDREIAEADEKEREFLARSAMLKQDLKVRRAYLCSSVPLPETFEAINLDDFLGKDLW